MTKTPHATFRLSEEDRAKLADLSRWWGDVSLSGAVRKLIREAHLKEEIRHDRS